MAFRTFLFSSFLLLITVASTQPVRRPRVVPKIKPNLPSRAVSAGKVKIDTSVIVPMITWGPERDTGGMSGGISATFYRDELLLVHKAKNSDRLYQNVYSAKGGQARWLGETRIPSQSSQDYPAIVTAGDKVVMVHTSGGGGSDHRMWLSVRTGESWDDDTSMGRFYRSNRGPALACDGSYVYIAYKRSDSNKIVFDYCHVPTHPSRRIVFGSIYNVPLTGRSSETAALAVNDDKVFLAYCGNDDSIWYSHSGLAQANFNPPAMVAGIKGKAPYLASDGKRLFLFFVTSDRRKLGYVTFNGTRWNEARYHPLGQAAHDVVVAVQPKRTDYFHLLYTAESGRKIYHSIGKTR